MYSSQTNQYMNITFLFRVTVCLFFSVNVQVSLDHFLDLKKNQQIDVWTKHHSIPQPLKKKLFCLYC